MDGNSLLAVPSTLESPLMQETLAAQSASTTNSPAGSLGNSITACKKVLRSNSLLESTDYWLQNQRTPCQIGFVEDKSENCASVCFVNLDVDKDACSTEHLQQKLVNVSPELPKLINSMNVQQPKENEIVLLSGLASGNLQADFEVSQCPWLPDICLVQCARGNRANSTNCIIFEINKFLIGLELVQERQLHLETKVLKVEDDTNCSLSSIEEDFLTASEHLEEESEVEEYRNGYENINAPVNVTDSKKQKEAPQEEWDYTKEKSPYTLEEKYIRKYHKPMIIKEGSLDNRAEDRSQKSLDLPAKSTEWKEEHAVNERLITNSYVSEKLIGPVKKSKTSSTPGDAYFSRMVKKDGPSACGPVSERGNSSDSRACEEERTALSLEQDGEATTGEYATNLAESVLQDAFIRLSQSQPPGLQESAGNALLPNNYSTKDIMVPRSWNELPKIVIVQSPDCGDVVPEPGSSSWSELEISMENNSVLSGDNASTRPQSALEVALACAATVIGTISSPQATERLKMEQESLVTSDPLGDDELLPTQTSQVHQELSISEYSFPSALCGMTQVASAVAVCGLGETEVSPMASNELFATEPPGAVTPLCSLATESNTELGKKEAIAEALFKETTRILTKPHAYNNMGDLMESMTKRITESASKPHTLCSENDFGNELAQTLSNAILKHSIDEVYQKIKVTDASDSSEVLGTLLETTNQILFNVICVTFKKMSNIMQSGTCPISLCKEPSSWRKIETGCQSVLEGTSQVQVNSTEYSSVYPLSNLQSPGLVTNDSDDDICPKQDSKGQLKSGLFKSPKLQPDLSYSNRVPDSLTAKLSHKEPYHNNMGRKDPRSYPLMPGCNGHEKEATSDGEDQTKLMVKGSHTSHCVSPVAQEKHNCGSTLNNEVQVNLSLLGSDLVLPTQAMLPAKHTELYYITDFAEELAETIVSMATEIAAICLDNSNGKQPWFCAWRRRNELLVAPSTSCRSLKRKKESQSGSGATVRKHKPPRLSEIKRKTDEHPELKEKLMNRVVDESMNLEDVPDSVNVFANEVAAKIMNLTEFSMVDGVWQAQSYPRNRLLSGERWNRLKASSCESIPEEESQVKGSVSSPGYMSTLSQPVSRASSVSKQSSCESISEEFSRFMVNQMESEGRGFELLLDYYAGKNASSILNSAIQQACRRSNDHLNVRSNCPSKQSSTESITEEFYRYMLRDMERENKDSASSRRSSHDWTASLLSSSLRLPQCYRQSSMPDSRSLDPRLVNAPIKANSLDGFAQNSSQDLLCVQPVSGSSSDSCLYRRGGTDQITTMLIHETWANSIEALMRKNKIIMDEAEGEGAEPNSPLQRELGTPGHSLKRGRRGSNLLAQESMNLLRKDSVAESKHPPMSSLSKAAVPADHKTSEERKEPSSCCEAVPLSHSRRSLCPREVPLIQIETHQRGEGTGESEGFISKGNLEDQNEHFQKRLGAATCPTTSDSLETRDATEAEVSTEGRGPDEFPNTLGSSGESTDSWSQLANEEDNPDDTSSFLQLSERSMSNGNSSATSSLGIMDLDIYQDNMPSSPMINELVEEKDSLKGQSEHIEEHVPGLPVGAASCQGSLLVINFDLEPECPDAELRATLQWIAASELGIPTIYFKKSQENRIEKFLDVVRLVHRKSWKVGDIFHAVVQYCKIHEEQKERIPSLFDWLLELG